AGKQRNRWDSIGQVSRDEAHPGKFICHNNRSRDSVKREANAGAAEAVGYTGRVYRLVPIIRTSGRSVIPPVKSPAAERQQDRNERERYGQARAPGDRWHLIDTHLAGLAVVEKLAYQNLA